MELKRGDLIEVRWLDITEDPVGNPSEAKLPTRHIVGYFWGATESTFTTTMTMDDDVEEQTGYCIYPVGVIVGIKRIRKGKGKKYAAGRSVRFEHGGKTFSVNPGAYQDVQAPAPAGVHDPVGGKEH